MEDHVKLSGIQPIPHKSNGGLGALETIFSYYGEQVFEPEGSGDLKRIAVLNGFEMNPVSPNLDAVVNNLASGTPVLTRYRDKKELKHAVVVGHSAQTVRFIDTTTGEVKDVSDDDFEAMWDKDFTVSVTPASDEFKKSRDFKMYMREERKMRVG